MADRRNLETLIARARQNRALPPPATGQDSSFVYGNANVDSDAFSRQTVTHALNIKDVRERGEAVNGVIAQYGLVLDLVKRHVLADPPEGFALTPALVCEFNRVALGGIEHAGEYRTQSVFVAGSPYEPPAPNEIDALVATMCSDVNARWSTDDALTLAAFVLWRLNWIHPFLDGNGRTARALSYAILSLALRVALPGEHTIPEQLRNQRQDYFDALEAADVAFQNTGSADVSALSALLGEMLRRQLSGEFASPPRTNPEFNELLRRRIGTAKAALRLRAYGAEQPSHRLWTHRDILILQLADATELDHAAQRLEQQGALFPRLFGPDDTAQVILLNDEKGRLLFDAQFTLEPEESAIALHRGAAATIINPAISGSGGFGWNSRGALYMLRFGFDVSPETFVDVFDLLIARHLALETST